MSKIFTHILRTTLQQYTQNYYPSCLVLGDTEIGKPVHVVCGIGMGKLWLITAYYPDPNEWEQGFKVRKEMVQ